MLLWCLWDLFQQMEDCVVYWPDQYSFLCLNILQLILSVLSWYSATVEMRRWNCLPDKQNTKFYVLSERNPYTNVRTNFSKLCNTYYRVRCGPAVIVLDLDGYHICITVFYAPGSNPARRTISSAFGQRWCSVPILSSCRPKWEGLRQDGNLRKSSTKPPLGIADKISICRL